MPSYWIFSTSGNNWMIARKKQIWATKFRSITQKISKGDVIILYVKELKSFCSILELTEDWYEAKEPVWSDELEKDIILYPYQTKVKIINEGLAELKKVSPNLAFIENKSKVGVYLRGTPANFGRPISQPDYQIIMQAILNNPLPPDIDKHIDKPGPHPPVEQTKSPSHNEIRDRIKELGTLENKVAEIEYPLDNLRLDVVWKTIPTGNPRWVFEVQLAGNFYEALTKLKHAWDKWNSKPFLVTTEEYQDRANQLLEGSFHEMKDDARVVNWKKIMKLYELIKAAQELKKEIRL
jgi:predicted RNA-binding protein